MNKSTVSEVLSNAFGSDFSKATQEQRLLLLEAVALSLRKGGAWQHNLNLVCSRAKDSQMPSSCTPSIWIEINRNEGLKLLAILNVAIVEGYSVVAASERLR